MAAGIMLLNRYKLALALLLLPGLAWGDAKNLQDTQAALQTARQNAVTHAKAATAAKAKLKQDEAQAALLAAKQIESAAALRRLENQTASAQATLAQLQAQAAIASAALQQSEAAFATLLPIMQRLAAQPAATILANPASPTDTIRGVLILQGIAANIESRAQVVKAQAQSVAGLMDQVQTQRGVLANAAAVQQNAEDALTAQITGAHAAMLADNDTADAQAAAAAAANRNIHDLKTMMDKLLAARQASADAAARIALAGGAPVAGHVTQIFGAATVAGPAEGVIYRAVPGARVAAPCAGPVLFANHFQSYGLLVILDCGGGYDFVLSGMSHLDVVPGQILAHGQPIGQMRRYNPANPPDAASLYVELRRNGTPVDPAGFLSGGSG